MKVLVTGAAGYVGWSAANKLVLSDSVDEVVVYDNFSRRNYGLLLTRKSSAYGKLTVKVDDILNSRGLRAAAQGADCICHLAALAPSPFADENPHAFDQVNHWLTSREREKREREKRRERRERTDWEPTGHSLMGSPMI